MKQLAQLAQPAPLEVPRRPDASMTLLNEVMQRPLDPGYAEAAAKRARQGAAGHVGEAVWLKALVLIGAMLLGLGTTIAAQALRIPQPAAREARLALEQQIRTRNDSITITMARIDALNEQVVALQEAALGVSGANLTNVIEIDGIHTGSAAATGPGMVVSLTNGGTGGLAEPAPESLVRDSDIQQVVQALWAAGAEAIAVGDQRLTMTTAVRNAGDAVLVDLVPMPGPTFVITALGDPGRLEAGWASSTAPAYLQLLGNKFGIRSSAIVQQNLAVPAASPHILHFATPIDDEFPAPLLELLYDDGQGSVSASGVSGND